MSGPDALRLRVLLGRPVPAGPDQSSPVWAAALRDAGFEVIVSGAGQAPDPIAHTAVQEDVDVIGMWVHSGSCEAIFADLLDALRSRGADDIAVFGGASILEAEARRIEAMGVARCFTADTPIGEVLDLVRHVAQRRRETKER